MSRWRDLTRWSLVLAAMAVVSVSCGGRASLTPLVPPTPAPTAEPSPTPSPVAKATPALGDESTAAARTAVSPTPRATAAPAATLEKQEYDSDRNLQMLFSGPAHTLRTTLDGMIAAAKNRDLSQVPALVDLMRFIPRGEVSFELVDILAQLTGRTGEEGLGDLRDWHEWLGKRQDKYLPPESYARWKTTLFSTLIDPRYEEFLGPAAVEARIDLRELMWGGVPPDGIPDLQNAPAIPGSEAEYLAAEDRVFGVSINGEHRAYPLRIMNPHEMANDVLGGEQIALAY